MPKSKLEASLAVIAGALAAAAHLNLPGRAGAIVLALVAAVAYVMKHDELLAAFTGKPASRGFIRAEALAVIVVIVWLGGVAMLAYAGAQGVATVFAVALFVVGIGRYCWKAELVGFAIALLTIHAVTACGVSPLQTRAQHAQVEAVAVASCVALHAVDAPDPDHVREKFCARADQLAEFLDAANDLVNAAGRADAAPE